MQGMMEKPSTRKPPKEVEGYQIVRVEDYAKGTGSESGWQRKEKLTLAGRGSRPPLLQ
jgi:hypothetical protein